MKKNLLLTIAAVISKLFCFISVLAFLILTVFLIHWHFNPDYYADFNLVKSELHPNSFGFSKKITWNIQDQIDETPFALNKVKPLSFYFNSIQLSLLNLLIFLIFKEFLQVITSVKMVQTFRAINVESFRRIGKYLFIFFVLSAFAIINVQNGDFYGLSIKLTPLLLMILAFILAEIFKEGNNLAEENNLTI